MAEVMAIETIAAEYAKLKWYFTQTRVPFKLKTGISDIDVLGYNPRTRKTIVVECKAWGSPDQYAKFTWEEWHIALRDHEDYFGGIQKRWKKFFVHSDVNKWKLSRLDEIWLVLPGIFPEKDRMEKWLKKELGITCHILPIHELLLRVISGVASDKDVRRKRYEDSAMEFCRWFVRSYNRKAWDLKSLESALQGK